MTDEKLKAHYHLPGLFEFYELYKKFLPLFYEHRDWFYDWCDIGSIYGAPGDCRWGGGRVGYGDGDTGEIKAHTEKYGISARLTFSNSVLNHEHLTDKRSNELLRAFSQGDKVKNGVIIYSDLLLNYIRENYPDLYFVSSTTKVITDFDELCRELDRPEFSYVVPDFRFNNRWDSLMRLTEAQRMKTELLCNECCYLGCADRKKCYENVSRLALGEKIPEHICNAPDGNLGYSFSKAMESPAFIGIEDIQREYLPKGFSHFKIEGRSLGSAMVLEFLLYYMTKPEHQIRVREKIYLDSALDLF